MNLIPCSSNCIYEKDGECRLDRALAQGQPGSDCAYYIDRKASSNSDVSSEHPSNE